MFSRTRRQREASVCVGTPDYGWRRLKERSFSGLTKSFLSPLWASTWPPERRGVWERPRPAVTLFLLSQRAAGSLAADKLLQTRQPRSSQTEEHDGLCHDLPVFAESAFHLAGEEGTERRSEASAVRRRGRRVWPTPHRVSVNSVWCGCYGSEWGRDHQQLSDWPSLLSCEITSRILTWWNFYGWIWKAAKSCDDEDWWRGAVTTQTSQPVFTTLTHRLLSFDGVSLCSARRKEKAGFHFRQTSLTLNDYFFQGLQFQEFNPITKNVKLKILIKKKKRH